jgi:ATP-dependent RNA helicase DDX47/RRP3
MIRNLGLPALPLAGKMDNHDRVKTLKKFKSGERPIMISTEIAARGLDLPNVELVINYDIPLISKEYIHQIGRTGRIGNTGKSISKIKNLLKLGN